MTDQEETALTPEEIAEEIEVIAALGLLAFTPSRVRANEDPAEAIVGYLLSGLNDHIHGVWLLLSSKKPAERAERRTLLGLLMRAVAALAEEHVTSEATEISAALRVVANREGR